MIRSARTTIRRAAMMIARCTGRPATDACWSPRPAAKQETCSLIVPFWCQRYRLVAPHFLGSTDRAGEVVGIVIIAKVARLPQQEPSHTGRSTGHSAGWEVINAQLVQRFHRTTPITRRR